MEITLYGVNKTDPNKVEMDRVGKINLGDMSLSVFEDEISPLLEKLNESLKTYNTSLWVSYPLE